VGVDQLEREFPRQLLQERGEPDCQHPGMEKSEPRRVQPPGMVNCQRSPLNHARRRIAEQAQSRPAHLQKRHRRRHPHFRQPAELLQAALDEHAERGLAGAREHCREAEDFALTHNKAGPPKACAALHRTIPDRCRFMYAEGSDHTIRDKRNPP
jgi:hypothetical protein